MTERERPILALFYCQRVSDSGDADKQALEIKYGRNLRLFPLPCGGRIEPLHMLRALEEIADVAFVITCVEDTCRYAEGNVRAAKRIEKTREILSEIGLEPDRVGIVTEAEANPKGLAKITAEIMGTLPALGISPLFASDP